MDRMACVELSALPLQLLLRAHPEWRGCPVALIEREAPHAEILCVNEDARRLGVAPGMRYSAALGLCARLCAGALDDGAVAAEALRIAERLRRFSPGVEACTEARGTFWLDTRGLMPLYPSLAEWASAIEADLRADGFLSAIAVGFGHFATTAIARDLTRGLVIFERVEEERAALLRVPLEHAGLETSVLLELEKLGVERIGDLLALSPGSLLRRFGSKVHAIHRRASGDVEEPLAPQHPVLRPKARVDLEFPEVDRARLAALCRELLGPLLARIEARGEVVATLELTLTLDDARTTVERLSPAVPTRDLAWLARLLELRFESLAPAPGIVAVALELTTAVPRKHENALFEDRPRRDPAAAAKAIDALGALFGKDSVVRARLREAHLPEARFEWTKALVPRTPAPRAVGSRSLVRRIFHAPHGLAPQERHASDGWLLRGVTHGSVQRLIGPHSLSGGWWRREVERDYHFAELKNGEIYWIFYDRRRRRWFLQGNVS